VLLRRVERLPDVPRENTINYGDNSSDELTCRAAWVVRAHSRNNDIERRRPPQKRRVPAVWWNPRATLEETSIVRFLFHDEQPRVTREELPHASWLCSGAQSSPHAS